MLRPRPRSRPRPRFFGATLPETNPETAGVRESKRQRTAALQDLAEGLAHEWSRQCLGVRLSSAAFVDLVRLALLVWALSIFVTCDSTAHAEDRTQPSIESFIGGWAFNGDHSYMAESRVQVPFLCLEPVRLTYDYHEVTPVLKEHLQTQLLTARHNLVADFRANNYLRLIAVGGYHSTDFEDRAGSFSAYEGGVGIGSPITPELPRLEWSLVAGGYFSQERLPADWWADLHIVWRAFPFGPYTLIESPFTPTLGLAADIESANEGSRFHALYKAGPILEVTSANGNRARFEARWYVNDGNPFFENRYHGLLIGVGVSSSLNEDKLYDVRDRPLGWLPVVWGQYDLGYGNDRGIQRTELNAEIHDFLIFSHPITAVLWYESRQEYRPGDFDNVSYSISFGAQTRIGLASFLSQGKPLIAGVEYVHRSAHSLAPAASRVPPPEILPHDSLNLGPRFRLQTLGWDLPYRDPERYRADAEWLNDFDWRITIGYDFHHSRDRSPPSGQLGLNWDIASLRGCVFYARGIGSIGNETPDWQFETGVRRRAGKLFFRYESYGLESQIARGKTAVVGIGLTL